MPTRFTVRASRLPVRTASAQPEAGAAPAEATPSNAAPTNAGPARSPKTAPPKVEQLPPFRVLLHNADEPVMDDVVAAIIELTPLPFERAVEAMLEAHETGVSLLLVTHRERAELYQEQFQTKQLTVTIEPAV